MRGFNARFPLAVALLLLVSACGDDDTGGGGATSTAPPATSTPSTEAPATTSAETTVAEGTAATTTTAAPTTTTEAPVIGDGVNWVKHAGNPVLDIGGEGAWDSELVGEARVVSVDGEFFMIYAGQDGTTDEAGGVSPFFGYGLGVATSGDGVAWDRAPLNPFITLGEGQYGMFWHGSSVVEGEFRSYYAIGDVIDDRSGYRIYGATSPDGETWTPGPDPIIDLGPLDSYDGSDALAPTILVEGGVHKMWYNAIDIAGKMTIAHATSADGVTWVKHEANPVVDLGPDAGPYYPTVLRMGDTYMMWFGGADGIHLATSPDGVTWAIGDVPVLTPGAEGDWDSDAVYEPMVLFDGQKFHMWFTGSAGPFVERIGYATSP